MTQKSWHPRAAPDLRPKGREVDIWAIDLKSPPIPLGELKSLLTAEEKARAERFHFPRHQRRFIVRRGAMRILLGAYVERPPEKLRFTTGKNGKPDLARHEAGPRLVFNLTDSADFALLAIGEGEELGVDVESLDRPRDAGKLVERFFSIAERDIYDDLPEPLKTAGFFRGWTSKEAYLKAIGTGLQTPLRYSTVELDPRRPPEMIEISGSTEEAAAWSLIELHPKPSFVGALALRRHGNTVRTFRWAAHPNLI